MSFQLFVFLWRRISENSLCFWTQLVTVVYSVCKTNRKHNIFHLILSEKKCKINNWNKEMWFEIGNFFFRISISTLVPYFPIRSAYNIVISVLLPMWSSAPKLQGRGCLTITVITTAFYTFNEDKKVTCMTLQFGWLWWSSHLDDLTVWVVMIK